MRRWASVWWLWSCLGLGLAGARAWAGADELAVPTTPVGTNAVETAGAAVFGKPTLVNVGIRLSSGDREALRRDPREYARATVTLDGVEWTEVGIKLKGAAGSFRPVDDRPALTLSFNKWVKGRRWQGLRQVHLNNSVQDSTLMNEYLAGELFRSVGVPATRVAWAQVTMDGRDLGVYVLKEAFEEEFLRQYFQDPTGNLYEGGFLQDIDGDIRLANGKGPQDRSDVKALIKAARESSAARRWERLQQVLDVDRFISYAAVSALLADWDGYAMNRNNYRVYFDPVGKRAVFFPHGTDQLLERNEVGMEPYWGGLVAQALLELPPAKDRYLARFTEIYTNQFRFEILTNLLGRAADALRPSVPRIDGRVRAAVRRLRERHMILGQEPALRRFGGGGEKGGGEKSIPADGWHPEEWEAVESGAAVLEETEVDGVRVLRIRATGAGSASFRATILLPRGRYRFEGRARCQGIVGTRDGRGGGAGLRISGSPRPREEGLEGSHGWTGLAYEFQLATDGTPVTLVVELRGSKGSVEFSRESLRLVPLGR